MLSLFVHGLRDPLRQQVILRDPKDIDEAEYAARLSESVAVINQTETPTVATIDASTTKLLQTLTEQLKSQERKLTELTSRMETQPRDQGYSPGRNSWPQHQQHQWSQNF